MTMQPGDVYEGTGWVWDQRVPRNFNDLVETVRSLRIIIADPKQSRMAYVLCSRGVGWSDESKVVP